MQDNNVESAQRTLDELLDYVIHFFKTGYCEDTYNFDHNYGYTADGKLIYIDIGGLHKGHDLVKLEIEEKKILKKESFQWLSRQYPELAKYLRREVDKKFDTIFL